MCIQSLYNAGNVREHSKCDGHNAFMDIRYDTSWAFQRSTLLFLCPITSIFLGIGRLENVWLIEPDQPDSFLKKAYFTLTGIIAMLGLGCIISAMRIVISVLVFICSLICLLPRKAFGDLAFLNIILMPFAVVTFLFPKDKQGTPDAPQTS